MALFARSAAPPRRPRPAPLRAEPPIGDRLPYAAQIDERTVITRDGLLCQFLHIAGLPFETVETGDLNHAQAMRESVLRAIADPQIAIYHHVLRRPVVPELAGTAPPGFCADVDAAWAARLAAKPMFVNELFLTVVRRPLRGQAGLLDAALDLLRPRATTPSAGAGARALDSVTETLLRGLDGYGARRLTSYSDRGRLFSECAEFLAFLVNGSLQPALLGARDLGQSLAARRISFGGDTIDCQGPTTADRRLAAMLGIKDYPPATVPGLFDALLRLPHEMVLTQSFGFVGRGAALGRMDLALRRMRAADDDALSLRSDLTQAKDDVAAGRSAFGEHHLSLQIRVPVPGDSAAALADLDAAIADVVAALADTGLIAVREDVALEPAFWAQFPGNFKDIPRPALIASGNFASLASLHNFPRGTAGGNHWGPAISVLETTSGTPYHFNWHVGDLGNFTVIGPSGSGKTVVLGFLLAQAAKLGPRVVFFDKDRGAEIFIRATGGRYSVLRPGSPSGLNPLALPDSPGNRRFLRDWIAQLLSPGAPLGAADSELVAGAVDANFEQEPAFRRLRYFRELLAGGKRPVPGDLAHRLGQWCDGGERGWLFDGATATGADTLDLDATQVGVDMTQLLDDPVSRTPAMMYLFHRVEERLDGSPAIIVVDEGWKALDDEVFVARIRDWEKTIRKRGGILGFATQNARDALDSRIGPAIVEQTATAIFMPNPKAQAADYMQGFGLTRHEFDLVRSLPDAMRAFLVKHGNDSVIARLDLSGLDRILTVLSGREASVRALDAIRARVGDDPADWLEPLLAEVAEAGR